MRVSKTDFDTFFKKSRVFQGEFLTLRVANTGDNETQFAFVVSKKVSKISPRRNLLKRRGRAVVKKNLSLFLPGNIYFFFFKKNTTNLSLVELEEEILSLLKKFKKSTKL